MVVGERVMVPVADLIVRLSKLVESQCLEGMYAHRVLVRVAFQFGIDRSGRHRSSCTMV